MFPTPLRLLAEVYRCARGSFWSYHIHAVTWLIDIHISVIYATTSRNIAPKFTRQYFTHTYMSIVLKMSCVQMTAVIMNRTPPPIRYLTSGFFFSPQNSIALYTWVEIFLQKFSPSSASFKTSLMYQSTSSP